MMNGERTPLKGPNMTKKSEVETTAPAVQADQKAQWQSPVLRRAGHLGDILQQQGKQGLSEHDPGVETYKPKGQDHH